MTKQEMVQRLVSHSVDETLHEKRCEWLATIFEEGFMGFRNMPPERLEKEMRLRGITTFAEPEEEIGSGEVESEAEIMVQLSGVVSPQPWNHFFD